MLYRKNYYHPKDTLAGLFTGNRTNVRREVEPSPYDLEMAPIFSTIDEYASWKFAIHPYQAGAQRSLLIRFAKEHKIQKVEDITHERMAFFVGGELSEYFTKEAVKTLRSFLWYCRKAGYNCIAHNAVSRGKLQGSDKRRKIQIKPLWEPGVI